VHKVRLIHEFIRDRIQTVLGERSWAWLARESGLPQSTLATQKAIPKFSVATLLAVSEALEVPPSYFFPPRPTVLPDPDPERDLLDELEDLIRRRKAP